MNKDEIEHFMVVEKSHIWKISNNMFYMWQFKYNIIILGEQKVIRRKTQTIATKDLTH